MTTVRRNAGVLQNKWWLCFFLGHPCHGSGKSNLQQGEKAVGTALWGAPNGEILWKQKTDPFSELLYRIFITFWEMLSFLLCNDKSLCTSVLPRLFLFRSYMSGVWMRKVCVNMYIISCCCCWQSSVKWGSEKALLLREACNSFTGCIICPFGKVKAMLLQA